MGMANRDNHYEAAMEAYLRSRQVPYVAVDEAKRSLASDGRSIKNLDFIVASATGASWLVDVKGRRFPSGDDQRHYWKNWSTRDDVQSLRRWEALFGEQFVGLFVFVVRLADERQGGAVRAGRRFDDVGREAFPGLIVEIGQILAAARVLRLSLAVALQDEAIALPGQFPLHVRTQVEVAAVGDPLQLAKVARRQERKGILDVRGADRIVRKLFGAVFAKPQLVAGDAVAERALSG